MSITINCLIKSVISFGSPKAYKYHGTGRFIDKLCAINDSNEFFKYFKNIYPKERELKVEYKGTRATFFDFDITIKDNIFTYKLFDKRYKFPLFKVRFLYLSGNIPTSIFMVRFIQYY